MNSEPSTRNKKNLIFLFLLSTAIVPLLYLYRDFDNNRLTSWNWAFSVIAPLPAISSVVIAAAAALVIVRFRILFARPILLLLIMSALPSVFMFSEPEVIVDASRYFIQAKHLELYGVSYFFNQWGHQINAWTDLPLMPFIYGLIFRFAGESRLLVQVLNMLMFSLTAVTVFHLGRTVRDRETGLYCGLFMLSMPFVYTQVPLMLVDTGTMFLLTLSVVAFINAMRKGRWWMILSAALIAMTFLVKYSTWVMMTVFVILNAAFSYDMRRAGDRNAGMAFRRGIMTGLAAIIIIAAAVIPYADVIRRQISLLVSYQKPALQGWGEGYISTFFYQIHPFVTLLALWSVYTAVRRKDFRYCAVSWLVVLMIYLGGWRIRYMLPVFPMIAVMAGYGLRDIMDSGSRTFTALTAFTTSAAVAIFIYLPLLGTMSQANLGKAGDFLNSTGAEHFEVITAGSPDFTINPAVTVPMLDLFTDGKICYRYIQPDLPEKILTSPLRFSWTFDNPPFYESDEACKSGGPLVVIIPEYKQKIPDDIRIRTAGRAKTAEFAITTEIFKYSPRVIIYR